MNESSSQPTSVNNWLELATKALKTADIGTARLDALLMLCDEIGRNKTWILAHPEHNLSASQQIRLAEKLSLRLKRMPMAYVRGAQEFYSRSFLVTNKVLVPRPETETLIDLLRELPRLPNDRLIDVGTGSGAIAISTKLTMPLLKVYATDIDEGALAIAARNAEILGAEVEFIKSDLLESVGAESFRFIAANLPYVDKSWEVSPEVSFEPELALFAPDNGLYLIKKLITQARSHLTPNGYLLLEADPRQHTVIVDFAREHGLRLHKKQDFILVLATN